MRRAIVAELFKRKRAEHETDDAQGEGVEGANDASPSPRPTKAQRKRARLIQATLPQEKVLEKEEKGAEGTESLPVLAATESSKDAVSLDTLSPLRGPTAAAPALPCKVDMGMQVLAADAAPLACASLVRIGATPAKPLPASLSTSSSPPTPPRPAPKVVRTHVQLYDDYRGAKNAGVSAATLEQSVEPVVAHSAAAVPSASSATATTATAPAADADGLTWRQRKRQRRKQNQLTKGAESMSAGAPEEAEAKDVAALPLTPPTPMPLDYTTLPKVTGIPPPGTRIAYKRLTMSKSYCPELSPFQEARVLGYDYASGTLTLQHDAQRTARDRDAAEREEGTWGKFELPEDCYAEVGVGEGEGEGEGDCGITALPLLDVLEPVVVVAAAAVVAASAAVPPS